jgi:hypothetical protein
MPHESCKQESLTRSFPAVFRNGHSSPISCCAADFNTPYHIALKLAFKARANLFREELWLQLLRNGATIAAFAAGSPVAQSVQSSGSVQPYLGAGTDANPGGVAPLADAERAAAAPSPTKALREAIGIAVLIVMVISC